ncbi:hypothetical protein [Paractinoplanes durhamensis]|uniref:hypothetical protein n=1 Tax=Paractinoplanes durhamensis TaxID=113563 RepID=UPI00363DE502
MRDATHRLAEGRYPDRDSEILPTSLGNVLRSYESRVGRPYGIEAIRTIPRLAMVAGERETAYMENQRTQLELAVRTSLLSLLGAVVTVLFFWRHGWWLLLALVPYTVAYLTYRGAVALAEEYGMSMAVMVDVSRFRLYDTLRLPSPRGHDAEVAQNAALMDVFGFGDMDLGVYAETRTDIEPGTSPPAEPDPDTA